MIDGGVTRKAGRGTCRVKNRNFSINLRFIPNKMLKKIAASSLLCLTVLTQGCLFSPKIMIRGSNLNLEQVDYSYLEGWQDDDHKAALRSFLHSCRKFAKMPQQQQIGKQLGNITVEDLRDVCEIANIVKTMSAKQARNFFENWFKPFIVLNKKGSSHGIFTGYYEANLKGSRVKTDLYQYPIYAKPNNLTDNEYFTREEIENGALEGRNLELLYVADKVELFFLHVQGSGRVELDDGTTVKIAYAAKNNRQYRSIGAYMEEQGLLPAGKVSAESIKAWLKEHPHQVDDVLNHNDAYVFFRLSNEEYVVGAQTVPLTTERSLAIDKDIMPFGFPFWVNTALKNKNGTKEKYAKLMIAQDTGSAIKGVVRGDIFFGHGKEAEEKASYMASRGEYYILLPTNIVDKISDR